MAFESTGSSLMRPHFLGHSAESIFQLLPVTERNRYFVFKMSFMSDVNNLLRFNGVRVAASGVATSSSSSK